MRPLPGFMFGLVVLALSAGSADADSRVANMKKAQDSIAQIEIGQPAPDFLAADSNGQTHKLSDLRGRIVVLEWTNDQCPFVRKFYDSGAMQAMQQDAVGKGVVWFTVVSSAQGKEGYTDAKGANADIAHFHSHETARLLDPTGTLGRLYGAKATPHLFIVDPNGVLAYNGAVDDQASASANSLKGATNYVTAALADLRAGRVVAHPASQVYGCSVKYADY